MRRIIPILALITGLTLSTVAIAQDAPPDPVAEVALDAAPADAADAAAVAAAPVVDALPPPIDAEPKTVSDGISVVTDVARKLGSREYAAAFFGLLMLAVAGARLAVKRWEDWFAAQRLRMLLVSVPVTAAIEATRAYLADQSTTALSLVFIALGAALGAAGAWTQRPAAQKAEA